MGVIEVGKILEKTRKNKNYSLADVQTLLKKQYNIDIDTSNIMRYEKGTVKTLNPRILRAICKILNIDYIPLFVKLGFLDSNFSNRKEAFNLKKSTVSVIELPVYGKASAGNGYINLEQEIYYMPVKKGDFSDRSFLVEVHGDSMYPTFDEGDFALIDPNNVDYIKNKVYVVTFNDESFIKRMTIDERTGYVILKSDNPSYDDIIINIEEQEYLKIEGRVTQIISNKYL